MKQRGTSNEDAFESKEGSGVTTTMATMQAKTARLGDLAEADRTAYFSVSALIERGKAVVEQTAPLPGAGLSPVVTPPLLDVAPPATHPAPEVAPSAGGPTRGFGRRLREASLPSKASLAMLPLLIGLFAVKAILERQHAGGPAEAPRGGSALTTTEPPRAKPVPKNGPAPASAPPLAEVREEPLVLPKGVSLERAAADAMAAGDFLRALKLYRELSLRQPGSVAYREASRILEGRLRAQTP